MTIECSLSGSNEYLLHTRFWRDTLKFLSFLLSLVLAFDEEALKSGDVALGESNGSLPSVSDGVRTRSRSFSACSKRRRNLNGSSLSVTITKAFSSFNNYKPNLISDRLQSAQFLWWHRRDFSGWFTRWSFRSMGL